MINEAHPPDKKEEAQDGYQEVSQSWFTNELIFNVWNWLIVLKSVGLPIAQLTGIQILFPEQELNYALALLVLMSVVFLIYFIIHRRDARWASYVVRAQKLFFAGFIIWAVAVFISYKKNPAHFCDVAVPDNKCDLIFRLLNISFIVWLVVLVPLWLWVIKCMNAFVRELE